MAAFLLPFSSGRGYRIPSQLVVAPTAFGVLWSAVRSPFSSSGLSWPVLLPLLIRITFLYGNIDLQIALSPSLGLSIEARVRGQEI